MTASDAEPTRDPGSPRRGAGAPGGGALEKSSLPEQVVTEVEDRFAGKCRLTWELTEGDVAEITALVEQLRLDQGGESEVTAAREALLQSVTAQMLLVRGAQNYITEKGIMKNREKGSVQPVIGEVMLPAMREMRQTLAALGLARRARNMDPLGDIVDETVDG